MLKYYANAFCKDIDKNLEINTISQWSQNLYLKISIYAVDA